MITATLYAIALNWTNSTDVAEAAMMRPTVQAELAAAGLVMPPISDAVTPLSNGGIVRQVVAEVPAAFIAMYPTPSQGEAVLKDILPGILRQRVPCVIYQSGCDIGPPT